MSEKEEYSDYVAHLSSVINAVALITGFMFASLTVLLTALPDLSSASSQLVLLIAACFLDVFVFILLDFLRNSAWFCKMPPLTRRMASLNLLLLVSLMLGIGMVTTSMFFAYNLTYLALAQLAMWITCSMATYVYIMRPMLPRRSLTSNKN